MPRFGSDLKTFLLDGISKYINLFNDNDLEDTFHLECPRKNSKDYNDANIKIFKDWDAKKGHKFNNYTESRQRLLSAVRRSAFLELISRSKDHYIRIYSPEEIAVNNEKQKREVEKKKQHPTDKYASDGESHPSSVESASGLLSPGTVGHFSPEPLYNAFSSDEFPSDAEMQELMRTFSDNLPHPDADLEADLSRSFDDLFSMYPSENGMEAIPESNSNSSTVEQLKGPRTPAGHVQVDSSSTAVENKPVLYLQTIQIVWQLITENAEENFCNEASTSNSCKQ